MPHIPSECMTGRGGEASGENLLLATHPLNRMLQQLRRTRDAQFAAYMQPMGFHSPLAHPQVASDLLAPMAFPDQLQNFQLSIGQLIAGENANGLTLHRILQNAIRERLTQACMSV